MRPRQPFLTQSIYHLVLESQLPHKIVNLIFQLVMVDNELTMFGRQTAGVGGARQGEQLPPPPGDPLLPLERDLLAVCQRWDAVLVAPSCIIAIQGA